MQTRAPLGHIAISVAVAIGLGTVASAAQRAPVTAAAGQDDRRLAELQSLLAELNRLHLLLREKEADNFVHEDYRLIRRPGYRIIFYFKRQPRETLAKYTSDPRFSADLAYRFTQQELLAIARPWVRRLEARNLLAGHVKNSITGEIRLDLTASEAEFNALVAREGWRVPEQFNLVFDSRSDTERPAPVLPSVPTGAKIEKSGFATIERAPPVPYPEEPPPPDNRPHSPAAWYARDLGISVEEAERRQAEQQALQPQFERLIEELRVREAGNFTAPRIVHKPDWAFVLYFKRDPERTLAKYTTHPRFKAALARFTQEELTALAKPWVERFTARKLAGAWGSDATYGVAEIMLNVTQEEYREIAKREGWGPVPDGVVLRFAGELDHASVADDARPFVRIFAQNNRSTIVQPEAGFSGRITMRDGCLYSGNALAYFHRETGIGVDEQGYLALTDRRTGKTKGRIGEWFAWAGPNHVSADMPMVRELRQRCGDAPIHNVGNPESAAQFRVQVHRIDAFAERRRISRERAWELLKQCWRKADAAKPEVPPDDLVRCD